MISGVEAMLFDRPVKGAVGWHLFANSAANGIVTTSTMIHKVQAVAFTQMSDAQKIEVLSASADTTQTVTVYGIDNATGKRASESIALNGTTPVSGAITFRYYEGAYLDKECAGAIVIQKFDDTDISGITVGDLSDYVLQHFTGEKDSYITMFSVGTDNDCPDTVTFDIRWYPDDADCLDTGDGFLILDRLVVHAETLTNVNIVDPAPHVYPQPIRCPAGGWISVWGTPTTTNSEGSALLQGFDTVAS